MTTFEAVFLGVLQGATEFLPVSSSGHLILAEHFMDLPDTPLAFDVTLHLGTLLAVLLYFKGEWFSMAASIFKRHESEKRRLFVFLLLGTIPGGLGGLLLSHYAETVFRSAWLVVITLLAVAVLMALAERTLGQGRTFSNIRLKDALIIGLSQALAIAPGVSRSGVTMSAAMFLGLEREAAAKFSFLLSAPIIAGSGLYEGLKMLRDGGNTFNLDFVWGFLAAGISGYLVVSFLMRYLVRHTLYPFVCYRIALAVLVAIILMN
jgi:undecaprenyl-diphosphatase